ncbi:MAG: glycerophosphodiester phosphodiesterase [Clostridiaceae bacterium]
MLIYAHRGYSSLYPENTMTAFKAAIDSGADGIETDIHLSRDGVIVITHDENIKRVSDGEGMVKDMSYDELLKYDFGSWKDERFKGEKIPTLSELLDLIEGTPLLLNIEIKMGFPLYPGIEEKALAMVTERGFLDRVIFSSFNHYSVAKIKKLNPAAKVAPLYSEGIFEPYNYAKTFDSYAIHPSESVIFKPIVDGCHQLKIMVNVWTVDEIDTAKKLEEIGVDAVITNNPLKLIKSLRS